MTVPDRVRAISQPHPPFDEEPMKTHSLFATACAAALSLCIFSVPAADADGKASVPAAESSQQSKMKRCNQEAGKKELKGDERKAFMSACLKA